MGDTIRFLQAEEDLLRPMPNVVLVQCVEMICMMACRDQKPCMRTIRHRALPILPPALGQPPDRTQPCNRSLSLGKQNGKSSTPTIILDEFLEAFHTPDRET